MQVFIDESGIHRQDGQSTTALVYVKVEETGKLNAAIIKVEKELHIEPFHWSKQIWKIRQAFLEAVLREDFEVKFFVFANPFTSDKFENALKHMLIERHIKNVIIDGDKPQNTVLRLKKILRDGGISVRKIRMGNDAAFPCLRLADLFAGLTRAYFNNKESIMAKRLYDLAYIKITTQIMGGQVSAG